MEETVTKEFLVNKSIQSNRKQKQKQITMKKMKMILTIAMLLVYGTQMNAQIKGNLKRLMQKRMNWVLPDNTLEK
jgi:hypothetical protein